VVAHVLRLRIDALFGALRGDRAHVIRMVAGLLVLTAVTVIAVIAVLSLRDAAAASAATVLVLAGAAVTLSFAAAPLVLGAVDPLDPRRFAVTGLAPGGLSAVLAAAGLISVPSFVLIAVSVGAAVVWVAQGAAVAVAVLAAVLGVLTCVLFARVSEAVAAMFIRERRSRELSGLFLIAVLVIVVPVGVFLASLEWDGVVPAQLRAAADVIALTPIGAAWALPTLSGGTFWGALVVAVATLGLLVAAWVAIVHRMLTTTERPLAVRERGGLGWFAVAPGTPAGAVAARSLVYWLRDRRYLVNVVIVPFAAVLTVVPLLFVGVPFEYVVLVPVPIIALFFGWLPHNDLAYDSTAVWMHIASGVRGAADRIGRLVPILLIGVPILAVAVPVAISLQGRWAILPALAGVCASLFLCGLGLSSIASAVAPYPVSRPGDSPFQQPQRTGSGGVVVQGLVMIGAIVLSAPALWWGWLTLSRDVSYAVTTLWAGLGTGLVVLAAGIAIGAAVFRRGGNRLMEFAESS
jgi:ABC-2 type transport system permease protein